MKAWIDTMRKVLEKKIALQSTMQRKRKVILHDNFKHWCKRSFLIKMCSMLYSNLDMQYYESNEYFTIIKQKAFNMINKYKEMKKTIRYKQMALKAKSEQNVE